MENLKFKIIRNVILAVLAVVALNLIVLASLGFPQMALLQLEKYWPLLVLLVAGFGVQIGLYTYLKNKGVFCSATAAASGGISSISMILCCSHYVVNILPFISASAATFLTQYTFQILLFGVISNVVGIIVMLMRIKKAIKQ